MTQILIDRATLEQLVGALEKHHKQETRYSDNKRRANATCAHFTVNPLQELAEQAYMLTHGKETIEAIASGRAAIAGAERVEPDTQLCKFYDVATYPDLVAAMEKHITKLQARTPPLTGEAFTQKPRFA